MQITRKKNLAYAKDFIQTDPNLPIVWLYFGRNSWDGKKKHPVSNSRVLVLPPGDDPDNYDFSILTGQWVFAFELGEYDQDYRRKLGINIFMSNPKVLDIFQQKRNWDRFIDGIGWVRDMVVINERYK